MKCLNICECDYEIIITVNNLIWNFTSPSHVLDGDNKSLTDGSLKCSWGQNCGKMISRYNNMKDVLKLVFYKKTHFTTISIKISLTSLLCSNSFSRCVSCNYCWPGVSTGWWGIIKKTELTFSALKASASVNQSLSPWGQISALSLQLSSTRSDGFCNSQGCPQVMHSAIRQGLHSWSS